jgi:nucleoside-diphosphate-sugar epimerase
VTRVHLTGGKGFLGRYAAAALAGGWQVEVSDVDTLDVTDAPALARAFAASKPDVVCHLAGLTGANASLADPARFFRVNLGGTLNALEACRKAQVGGFVFLSSLTVHGQSSERVTEDTPFAPRHPYAGSKAAAEEAVRTYAASYGLRAAILRPTLIAGEGQAEPNAVTEFADTLGRGGDIVLFGDGSHAREWLHPSDVGAAIRAAVEHAADPAHAGCEAFLVSSGVPVTMAELARLVIREVGRGRLVFEESTRQAFSLCTASDKAARLLGFRPAIGIEEIVRRTLASAPRGRPVGA